MTTELDSLSDSELHAAAEDVGLRVSPGESRASLLERVRARREVIDQVSREELARILRWANGDVRDFHVKDVLVRRFYLVSFRRTRGLTLDDLRIVAKLRGIAFEESTTQEELAARVEKHSRRWSEVFKRAGSRVMGFLTRRVIGPDTEESQEEGAPAEPREGRISDSLKRGFKAALKYSVDDYVREKLDEIEARIDRKLDEIDRKMDDWRTKEVRHRIRIFKITLIMTAAVAAISLVYVLLRKYGM